jgi:CheY-like chemotaxis protein
MARILTAEADLASRKLLAHIVDSLGHSSFVSPNGQHAWEALDCGNNFAMLITE